MMKPAIKTFVAVPVWARVVVMLLPVPTLLLMILLIETWGKHTGRLAKYYVVTGTPLVLLLAVTAVLAFAPLRRR